MVLLPSFRHRLRSNSAYAEAARSLIATLNAVDEHPQLYLNEHVLQYATHRYEHIWIPLLARVDPADRIKLVPPLDVEWVWICHMLAPHIYGVDSAAMWKVHVPHEEGHVVDHAILDAKAREQGLSRAKSLWCSHFPDEPFNILAEIDSVPLVAVAALVAATSVHRGHPRSRITYDIVSAAERQMAFHYQVAIMPHYRHSGFLEAAAARYKKFLRLHKVSESRGLNPTYDIDLMWHIHQLHPQLYARQTKQITGRLLPHDNTLNDRAEGAALSQVWEATGSLWSVQYGDPIVWMGGMFRGDVTVVERQLRARLEADVADLEASLPDDREKGYTMDIRPVRERVTRPPALDRVEWVHLSDVNMALKAGCEGAWRTSELAIADTDICLEARLTNVAVLDDIDVYSAVEIFDVRNAETAYALPIASAHVAPPGSVVLHEPGRAFRPHADQGETLVLRIAGRDIALLAGQWVGYVRPVADMPGRKGVQARPGALRFALAFLDQGSRWTALVSEYGGHGRAPPVFVIGEPEKFRLRVDLAAGSVQFRNKADAVLASVVGMGAALLHVRLQPRFDPGRVGISLYPTWMVQQQEHPMLIAGGGEWQHCNKLVGYGPMLAGTAAASGLQNSSKVWPETQPRFVQHGGVGRHAQSFEDGMMFGYVEGYS